MPVTPDLEQVKALHKVQKRPFGTRARLEFNSRQNPSLETFDPDSGSHEQLILLNGQLE